MAVTGGGRGSAAGRRASSQGAAASARISAVWLYRRDMFVTRKRPGRDARPDQRYCPRERGTAASGVRRSSDSAGLARRGVAMTATVTSRGRGVPGRVRLRPVPRQRHLPRPGRRRVRHHTILLGIISIDTVHGHAQAGGTCAVDGQLR